MQWYTKYLTNFKQPSQKIGREHTFVSVYATGLNNRDDNLREEMKLLTRWGLGKIILHMISKYFFSND